MIKLDEGPRTCCGCDEIHVRIYHLDDEIFCEKCFAEIWPRLSFVNYDAKKRNLEMLKCAKENNFCSLDYKLVERDR